MTPHAFQQGPRLVQRGRGVSERGEVQHGGRCAVFGRGCHPLLLPIAEQWGGGSAAIAVETKGLRGSAAMCVTAAKAWLAISPSTTSWSPSPFASRTGRKKI
ncbi:hypothetical protein FM111_07975 [Brevundimonas diminuta 3F5N]|uniref:Uncharacterized protein n=1 Tax=Brevundimonas diminuta 3F5N TaxID=1255603 RepID=A0A1R4FYJ8_BREDI|nr:hypothetical protein FM111_07975 [Brevundimonas diminuta 3F5N]